MSRIFTFNPINIILYFPDIDKYISDTIFRNNKEFTAWKDPETGFPVIRCENAPMNLYATGVIWNEQKTEK